MTDLIRVALPHGIELEARVAGSPDRPLLLFLHGFPESAFVWDDLLHHFSRPEHGGYRCVAPCLRGYPPSSAPLQVSDYRAQALVQDVVALAKHLVGHGSDSRLAGLVAHDWGGAVAWNVAALHPDLVNRLIILNAPHPGTFLRELVHSPAQRAASEYMRFLCRPDAAQLLAQDDYRRLWSFFESSPGGAPWLTDALKSRYRTLWDLGLDGPLNYYRASPLRPPGEAGVQDLTRLTLPPAILSVECPTLVLWGMRDHALLPGLLDGLADHVASLQVVRLADASHWLVHEIPGVIAHEIQQFLPPTDQAVARGRL